ncbi:SERTA domain-containing protein 1 isoform X1 [Caretta caretta]|uniref:SERTA domain-containing protein 1 isoform X1 n=2 Tax=Caretta caretta TaxID=8467 RepID=UPI0020958870|nr:SERTA domain-containing protein 1 isoform X1 [Caretta caretta]
MEHWGPPARGRPMLAKGVKRTRGEMEGGEPEPRDPGAAPASSLFNISMLKLHQSLRLVEPNLRHLVLVANTLRRMQDQMQQEAGGPVAPDSPKALSGVDSPAPASDSRDSGSEPCRQPPSDNQGDDLLLSTRDASISAILEDLGQVEVLSPARPEEEQLLASESGAKQELARTSAPCLGPLELLSSAGSLLEDGLEDIFEDIDTSMYDCDLWSPTSLSGFKAFSGAEDSDSKALAGAEDRLDMSDLDYLMDVLVGGHAL